MKRPAKLSKRMYEFIGNAMRTVGFDNWYDPFCYIEERLTGEEAVYVQDFLEWLHKSGRPFGQINYEVRWAEYISETKKSRG